MAKGLILVDIQNEYFPGGRMELQGIEKASTNARSVLTFFRDRGWPTFHVQHLSTQPDAPLFTPKTPYVELHQRVRPLPGEGALLDTDYVNYHTPAETQALRAVYPALHDDPLMAAVITAVQAAEAAAHGHPPDEVHASNTRSAIPDRGSSRASQSYGRASPSSHRGAAGRSNRGPARRCPLRAP